VTCDLSQIEARLVAWICGCTGWSTSSPTSKDPYSLLASEIFGSPINRKLKDALGKLVFEIEGFIGKTGILGLGYGCGKDNFDTMVIRSARSMALDISEKYTRDRGQGRRRLSQALPRNPARLAHPRPDDLRPTWLSGSASRSSAR
jgi:hypothetical protein